MWIRKQSRLLFFLVLLLFLLPLSLHGQSSVKIDTMNSNDNTTRSSNPQMSSNLNLIELNTQSTNSQKLKESYQKELKEQSILIDRLETILKEQEISIQKLKTSLKNSDEEIKRLSESITKLKKEIAEAYEKIKITESKIVELELQIGNYNENVKSELHKKDREIVLWKCVGGVSIGLVVVTATGVIIASVVDKTKK